MKHHDPAHHDVRRTACALALYWIGVFLAVGLMVGAGLSGEFGFGVLGALLAVGGIVQLDRLQKELD